MADLLECLVQIRALAETVGRLTRLAAAFPAEAWSHHEPTWPGGSALDIVARMSEEELVTKRRLQDSLRRRAPRGRQSSAPAGSRACCPDNASPLDRFAENRRDNLLLLSACSAEDLALRVADPARGEFHIADLVAEMLAHDTDHLGEILRRLSSTVEVAPTDGEL